MDRLTFEGNFCDISRCQSTPGGSFCEDGACSQRKVWERLKEYEDAERRPEEVQALNRLFDYALTESRTLQEQLALIERLRELAEADKDGRLVVLPCKVGEGLWTFCSHPVEQVYSFTVTSISTLNGRTMLNTSRCGVIDARDVGKTVFLTHKEAEKALEAMKDG